MRTAILTDVHANLKALTACIAAAEAEQVDRFVCLGDTVDNNNAHQSYYPQGLHKK